MAFWNFQKLQTRVQNEQIISPYNDQQAQGCAYELCLGEEVCVTSDDTNKTTLGENETVKIPSGQFALLITQEVLKIPLDTLALISIKFGIKAQGLINVSGFHVDPGFHGRLKFSVYNAGAQTVVLERGQLAFMIWFTDLTAPTQDQYNGVHQGQMHISSNDVRLLQGEIASPGQLRKKLADIELSHRYKTWLYTLIVGLGVGILLTALGNLFTNLYKEPSEHIIFDIKEKVKAELKEELESRSLPLSNELRKGDANEPAGKE